MSRSDRTLIDPLPSRSRTGRSELDLSPEAESAGRSESTRSWTAWKWLGFLLLILFVGILFVVINVFAKREIQQGPEQVASPEAIDQIPDSETDAFAELEKFFNAPDLASKAAYVLDEERVLPMMKDFHIVRHHPYPFLSNISSGVKTDFDDTTAVLFKIDPFAGPPYPLAMIWDGSSYKVDWESLTAYGTMDWSEFLESRPTDSHTMRVFIRASDVYPPTLNGDDGLRAFQIEHRDHTQPIIAVTSGVLAEKLALETKDRRVPVTLEIAWEPLEGVDIRIPRIIRLLRIGWSL